MSAEGDEKPKSAKAGEKTTMTSDTEYIKYDQISTTNKPQEISAFL